MKTAKKVPQTSPDPANPPIDQLQASLFYLMTQYSFDQCPSVAYAVVDHLNRLLTHPHIDLLPTQYSVLARLVNKWQLHGFEVDTNTSAH